MRGGVLFFFFFSSRRRHTRWTGDWSSDVCSSDLPASELPAPVPRAERRAAGRHRRRRDHAGDQHAHGLRLDAGDHRPGRHDHPQFRDPGGSDRAQPEGGDGGLAGDHRGRRSPPRPILLTAAAAILGMIPIMGDVFWGPMAFAIVGGLAGATLLTMLFLPALYVAWFRIREDEPAPQGQEKPQEPPLADPKPA